MHYLSIMPNYTNSPETQGIDENVETNDDVELDEESGSFEEAEENDYGLILAEKEKEIEEARKRIQQLERSNKNKRKKINNQKQSPSTQSVSISKQLESIRIAQKVDGLSKQYPELEKEIVSFAESYMSNDAIKKYSFEDIFNVEFKSKIKEIGNEAANSVSIGAGSGGVSVPKKNQNQLEKSVDNISQKFDKMAKKM